ncbi:MAG: type II toxin-antitoxin system VapC family toxin [Deltaproteobacteria bacterium]|nr:type II toxin-antitoxin system VapC family toxin [Deltaproteobacteria bacterium]
MIVADTDVLIDARRGKEPALTRIDGEIARGTLATTTVTAFELWTGARSTNEAERVDALLASIEVLALDHQAAREAGRLRRELQAKGEPIGIADCLIAGICLSRGLPLLTRNVGHFGRVEGLTVEDAT